MRCFLHSIHQTSNDDDSGDDDDALMRLLVLRLSLEWLNEKDENEDRSWVKPR